MTAPAPTELVDERYALVREIARGGMGTVLEARHVVLRTPVAIKLLHEQAAGYRAAKGRLMREAQLLALCAHPHVARVLDAGTCATHGPFIALEMIDGRSLDGFVAAGRRMSAETVAAIGAQVAGTLAHVHSLGVVHRDVKPANVLVSRGPNGDLMHLIDFGIAALVGESGAEAKLTVAGELLGTPEFVAPEVLLEEATAAPSADVYALGVMLYECLTGTVPIPGNPLAVMSAHAKGVTPTPLAELRADVSAALASAVMAALARDPSGRPRAADLHRSFTAEAAGRKPSLLEQPKPSDARVHRRAPYSAPVRLVTTSGPIDGRTEDISEGGVLVVLSDLHVGQCTSGDAVMLRMPLPSTGRIAELPCTVRWTTVRRGQQAVGLELGAVPSTARAELGRYVRIVGSDERHQAGVREVLHRSGSGS